MVGNCPHIQRQQYIAALYIADLQKDLDVDKELDIITPAPLKYEQLREYLFLKDSEAEENIQCFQKIGMKDMTDGSVHLPSPKTQSL